MTELLRPARPADAERIVDIWASGWRDGHLQDATPEILAHRTRESFVPRVADALDRTTVAEVDGEIAGFAMVHDDAVDQLYVDPAHRGSGIASRLLADTAAHLRAAGHPVPWLAVARGNARARHFYEREGWTDAGEFSFDAPIGGGATMPFPCHRMELRADPSA